MTTPNGVVTVTQSTSNAVWKVTPGGSTVAYYVGAVPPGAVFLDSSGHVPLAEIPDLSALYVKHGTLALNVLDYGFKGDGTVENTTSLYAAITAAPAPVTVLWPPPSVYYNLTSPLPNVDGMRHVGSGMVKSKIVVTSGSLINTAGSSVQYLTFENLNLQTNGSHLIDLGTNGAMNFCRFVHCYLQTNVNGSSIWNGSGTCNPQQNLFEDCHLTRPATATVPAINLATSALGMNQNKFADCTFNSGAGTTGGYFVRMEATAGYAYGTSFVNITGEQNASGLIWLLAPHTPRLVNIIDYDVTGAYTASLVKISKSAGYPQRLMIDGVCNTSGTGIDGVSNWHVDITDACYLSQIDRVGDAAGNAYIKTAGFGYGVNRRDAWGVSSTVGTQTANYTLSDLTDGTVVFNGTSLTATLPDPTSGLVPLGRKFTVKNINTSALTVVSAGTSKTVDGAASQSLAQWAKATYITDGTQWLSV